MNCLKKGLVGEKVVKNAFEEESPRVWLISWDLLQLLYLRLLLGKGTVTELVDDST